jgi:hypothetical protein
MGHQYLGVSLARQGRLEESLAEYLKARELDPLSSILGRESRSLTTLREIMLARLKYFGKPRRWAHLLVILTK